MSSVEVRSDRNYRFEAPPETVWNAIGRVDDYRTWWPWLHQFDAAGLIAGDEWRCTLRPPLPYVLSFSLRLGEVVPHERITATVEGDIVGRAELTITPDGGGTAVGLVSTLAPHNGVLRAFMAVAPWLARFGHDWVLDTGLQQFRTRAL